jgi:hypothetical protein
MRSPLPGIYPSRGRAAPAQDRRVHRLSLDCRPDCGLLVVRGLRRLAGRSDPRRRARCGRSRPRAPSKGSAPRHRVIDVEAIGAPRADVFAERQGSRGRAPDSHCDDRRRARDPSPVVSEDEGASGWLHRRRIDGGGAAGPTRSSTTTFVVLHHCDNRPVPWPITARRRRLHCA